MRCGRVERRRGSSASAAKSVSTSVRLARTTARDEPIGRSAPFQTPVPCSGPCQEPVPCSGPSPGPASRFAPGGVGRTPQPTPTKADSGVVRATARGHVPQHTRLLLPGPAVLPPLPGPHHRPQQVRAGERRGTEERGLTAQPGEHRPPGAESGAGPGPQGCEQLLPAAARCEPGAQFGQPVRQALQTAQQGRPGGAPVVHGTAERKHHLAVVLLGMVRPARVQRVTERGRQGREPALQHHQFGQRGAERRSGRGLGGQAQQGRTDQRAGGDPGQRAGMPVEGRGGGCLEFRNGRIHIGPVGWAVDRAPAHGPQAPGSYANRPSAAPRRTTADGAAEAFTVAVSRGVGLLRRLDAAPRCSRSSPDRDVEDEDGQGIGRLGYPRRVRAWR